MIIPRTPIGRRTAACWLLGSAVLFVITLLRIETGSGERSALSTLVALYFMAFPAGHLGVLAIAAVKIHLYVESQAVLSIGHEAVALWIALTLLGYFQWFVALPRLAQGCRWLAAFLFKRIFAR